MDPKILKQAIMKADACAQDIDVLKEFAEEGHISGVLDRLHDMMFTVEATLMNILNVHFTEDAVILENVEMDEIEPFPFEEREDLSMMETVID